MRGAATLHLTSRRLGEKQSCQHRPTFTLLRQEASIRLGGRNAGTISQLAYHRPKNLFFLAERPRCGRILTASRISVGPLRPDRHLLWAVPLFPPSKDSAFAKSIGGMIWPRGYVAAASFYNFNASVNAADSSFVDAIWTMNDKMVDRKANVCPSRCKCDQLTACGKPYYDE